ncbi:MAG: hypothetical protein ACR2G3_11000 [Solirubrobacterales bacterium]
MDEGVQPGSAAAAAEGGIVAFARKRSLEFNPAGRTSDATPYLSRLQEGRSLGAARGQLAAGLEGTIASVEVETMGQDPNHPPRPPTLRTGLETRIPETIGLLPVLTCRDARKDLLDRTFGAGGIFKLQKEVEFESIKLGRKFLIGVAEGQDENWVRQLFSPSFVDYLAETAPPECEFELYHGVLAVGTPEKPGESTLEALCAVAVQVAERLRAEALEQEGLGGRSWRGADDERLRRHEEDHHQMLAGVRFERLPATVGAAADRFAGRVRRMPFVWISALLMAMLLALVIVALPAVVLVGMVGFISDGADLPWGAIWAGVAAIYALVAFLLTIKLARGQIEIRKTMLGLEAFLRLYAGENGLELVEGRRFHSENVRADIPGVALFALRGALPGAGIDGALVVAKDQAKRQQQVDYGLAVLGPAGTLKTSEETPVAGWSAQTLDDFCASASQA